MGTTGPRAQPFTNTLERQSSGVTTPRVAVAYPRRTATALSPFSLSLIARVPDRNPLTNFPLEQGKDPAAAKLGRM